MRLRLSIPTVAVTTLALSAICLSGCGPREQTRTLPLSIDRHEDEITNRYRTLGDLAIDHLGGARVDLDRYCVAMGTEHHTNITVLSCGYDFHTEAWIGRVLLESTCTFGEYKANLSRELEFERPVHGPDNKKWSEGTLKSSQAVFMVDTPMVVRDILEGFDDTLSKHYPKRGEKEMEVEKQWVNRQNLNSQGANS